MLELQLLFLVSLLASASVLLLEKWQVDDYLNAHRFWSRYWPRKPCLLCRGFWLGCGWLALLLLFPALKVWTLPLAALPLQLYLVQKLLPYVLSRNR